MPPGARFGSVSPSGRRSHASSLAPRVTRRSSLSTRSRISTLGLGHPHAEPVLPKRSRLILPVSSLPSASRISMPIVSMPFALTASKQPIARKLFAHYGRALIAHRFGGPRATQLPTIKVEDAIRSSVFCWPPCMRPTNKQK